MIDEKVKDSLIAHKKKVIWQADQTLYSDKTAVSQKAASLAIPKGESPASW